MTASAPQLGLQRVKDPVERALRIDEAITKSIRVLARTALEEAVQALAACNYVTAERAAYLALQLMEALEQRRMRGTASATPTPPRERK